MATETLPNYAPVIRAQIAREVAQAKVRIESGCSTRALSVAIGYVTNSHRGMALYVAGDEVAGLPVNVDRLNPNGLVVKHTSGEMRLR